MAEVELPPIQPELPEEQLPEVEKPAELSKVISIKFNPLDTKRTVTTDTKESFFTTDTDAWVVFNVDDMNQPTGKYSLVLYNREDGSIFQRAGDIVAGSAYYKLQEEELRHAGRWTGQVVITLNNGKTTTSRFSFLVSGHLLDGKDIRQIVIEDFQTLMLELEEMKNDVGIDFSNLKHDIEEAQRLAVENEQSRQAAFETNENNRQESEDTRVSSEETRVVSEESRATAETTRKANEDGRVTAENERKTAETARQAGYEGFDGRITEIEDDVVVNATNLIKNSDFSNGLSNWSGLNGVISATNNIMKITGDGTHARVALSANDVFFTGKVGHFFYTRSDFKMLNVLSKIDISIRMHPQGTVGANFASKTPTVLNTLQTISGVGILTQSIGNFMFQLTYSSASQALNSTIEFSKTLVIDLTETFGAGNEPTQSQMDRLLAQFPNSWFDGTRNLFLAKWALNEMRRLDNEKANRKQEDWITPVLSNGATGTIKFRKNNFGELEFKGTLKSIEGVNSLIFPQGYIVPSNVNVTLPTVSNAPTLRNVLFQSSGGTYFGTPYGSAEVSLEGLILPL